mmetsp:Transcript_17151/g.30079  ORF Transcript_17151/g.30079 Transcript_17151/m.30079 type:complete len:121 (+) Transcript_17151:74-436(+)|eukprot:CAMPEP_0197646738 /NCGR_PEP_ID=MMETSP1338-20131121/23822_1 /TAXON_ID=43686 ORGANISM="Pelagodinium beii, Strain RCC1491" /NCGR_SAMPLE_ID=MMETSP1338 /ASSEMBLY_ACC=CAM_ASM_000754 /LENGTH=120 /DNA_ID=CAMNT_0043220399 /DNA_START=60 /DNA_END=422 /DNA_ORIENTATION=+
MMLGRLAASRFGAGLAKKGGLATPFSTRAFAAVKVSSPRPLSIRGDSLMVQCVVAALVYFVPQDIVFLGGLFWSWHTTASLTSPKAKQADADSAVEEFKAKKGLEKVSVYKGRSTWQVSI